MEAGILETGVTDLETVLIFTGGDTPPHTVLEELPRPDLVVAADSGYDAAIALGFKIDALVGDLDSIRATEIPSHVIVEKHPTNKDATDLELALQLSIRDTPARIVVVAGSGGRLDHELATALLLCSPRWKGIDELDWVNARGRSHVIHRRRLLHGDIGATLSLIAVGGDALGVQTSGLRWDLDNETLHHGATRGVSNVMQSPIAEIGLEAGCLLAVFPAF